SEEVSPKGAAEEGRAASGEPPSPGTPAVKDGKPAEKAKPSDAGEATGGEPDPLADLTDAQLLGFLVPGHSRPPAPSAPVWDDTATPAGSGLEAGIPAQSAPPDTTRKEAPPMGSTSAGSQLAAKHQTDITFDQYLVGMTNIALAALSDKETAEEMIGRLLATAKALQEIADDLADDHNIDKKIVAQISELSEALNAMTAQATRCAQECADAAEAAVQAAGGVARVYGQDMDAKREAGLVHTSAAAHHN
ncbi:ATP/GTP-binding protein, partial [Streptomyces albidoflavus]